MAWERKIPFGYMIQNGELLPHPQESEAVKMIFSLYCGGASYGKIAAEMMRRGISYYRKTNRWNKNMVSRILENERYLGADSYPRLVSDSKFLSVQLLRQTKTAYTPCPAEIRPIKSKAVCAICGAKMWRDTKSGHPRWRCENPDCGQIVRISDSDLLDGIKGQLQRLAQNPDRLTVPDPPQCLSIETIRIQKELALCFNRSGTSPEYMKALIFAAAEERYKSTPAPTPAYEIQRLQERLKQSPNSKESLIALFQHVTAILIGAEKAVSLRLPGGTAFNSEEGE